VILFRIIVISFMYQTTEHEEFFKTYARLLATSLAAAINSIVIEAGGMIFQVKNEKNEKTKNNFLGHNMITVNTVTQFKFLSVWCG
jgi:hypothetical protein